MRNRVIDSKFEEDVYCDGGLDVITLYVKKGEKGVTKEFEFSLGRGSYWRFHIRYYLSNAYWGNSLDELEKQLPRDYKQLLNIAIEKYYREIAESLL